jgi:hypothetical protein
LIGFDLFGLAGLTYQSGLTQLPELSGCAMSWMAIAQSLRRVFFDKNVGSVISGDGFDWGET